MHLVLGHNYILPPPDSPSLLTPLLTGSGEGVQNFAASSHPLSSSLGKKGVGDFQVKETVSGHMTPSSSEMVHPDQHNGDCGFY